MVSPEAIPPTFSTPEAQVSLLHRTRLAVAQELIASGVAQRAWELVPHDPEPLITEKHGLRALPIIMRDGHDLRIGFLLDFDEPQHSSVRSIRVQEASADDGVAGNTLEVDKLTFDFLSWYVEHIEDARKRGLLPDISEDLLFVKYSHEELH